MTLQFGKIYFCLRRQCVRNDFETENINFSFLGLYLGIGKKKEKERLGDDKDLTAGDIKSYINNRWRAQRDYFSKKSQRSHSSFVQNQILIVVFCAFIVTILSIDLDSIVKSYYNQEIIVKKMYHPVKGFLKDETIKEIEKKKDIPLPWYHPDVFSWNRFLCALFSLGVIAISGIDRIKQNQEEWIKNRNATEKMKNEIVRYKFGVSPYTQPVDSEINKMIEDAEEGKPDSPSGTPGSPDSSEPPKNVPPIPVSDRSKLFLKSVSDIASKTNSQICTDFTHEISCFIAGDGKYCEKTDNITEKDKIFIARLKELVEKYKQSLEERNLFVSIKNEIDDYYIDEGLYKPKDAKKDDKKKVTGALSDNFLLFVERVETIISDDVNEFLALKRNISESDAIKLAKDKGYAGGKNS